jgi:predicted metal-dependent enzyme (double-stranded beta helix superfamily)
MHGEARHHPGDGSNIPIALAPGGGQRLRMLAEIGRAVEIGQQHVDERVARILAAWVAEPALLAGLSLTGSPTCYTRHILEAGCSYCVMAIVWLPGQASPIHAHRTWCSFGVHRGVMTETHYFAAASAIQIAGVRELRAGATSHGLADRSGAHQMANLGHEPAISVHAYGVSAERIGLDLNEIWAGAVCQ